MILWRIISVHDFPNIFDLSKTISTTSEPVVEQETISVPRWHRYHFLFRFKDGLIVELKEYMDTERVTDILCGGQRPPA